MNNFKLDFEVTPVRETEPDTCKGLVFRGYSTMFKSGNHIGYHQGIKLLKRKSCPGCEKCDGLMNFVTEDIYCNNLEMPQIEHGKLYSIQIVVDGTDWESGLVDACHAEVFEVQEEQL